MKEWETINKIPAMFEGNRTRAEVANELGWPVRKLDYWIKALRKTGVVVNTYTKGRRPLSFHATNNS